MFGKLTDESDQKFPYAGKTAAEGQSPLLRTAQLNIALEEERMIVGEMIVAGRGNVCLDNLSLRDWESGTNVSRLLRTIAGDDKYCI
jgi:hypothetical protein